MYDPRIVEPMRKELTSAGFEELKTPQEVDSTLKDSKETVLVVVNSVCGCAAGGCRPGVVKSISGSKKPTKLTTVFAGQDKEATERARSYFTGYPPSSPAIALLKEGQVVFMLPRHKIEGRSADDIAKDLQGAYEQYC